MKNGRTITDAFGTNATRTVVDMSEQAAEITKKTEPEQAEVQLFLQRRKTMRQTVDATAEGMKVSAVFPAVGGVSAGVYFRSEFPFQNETAIHWRVVAPQNLGGVSESLVYVTSSNHASRGTETLISYRRNNDGVLRVFDWSAPSQPGTSRFVVAIPFSEWGPYLQNVAINGKNHPAIQIVNQTRRVEGTSWINEVFLLNMQTNTFDQIWRRAFTWNADADPSRKFFGWGPIIEPFPPFRFQDGNQLGFAGARLVVDGTSHVLTPANSMQVGRSSLGFAVTHVEANHTLLAR